MTHKLNMWTLYLCTFDNNFGRVAFKHYDVYTAFGVLTLFICVQFKHISFLYIQTLHNDCSHVEDLHWSRRSKAEFGVVCDDTLYKQGNFQIKKL